MVDDIRHPLPGLPELVCGLSSFYRQADLVLKFDELGFRISAFLEIEICTAVECLDHYFLPAPAGEEDEGKLSMVFPDVLEKSDAVHDGHLVV